MAYLHPDWYTQSTLSDGRKGNIINPTLRGALEISAMKFKLDDTQDQASLD